MRAYELSGMVEDAGGLEPSFWELSPILIINPHFGISVVHSFNAFTEANTLGTVLLDCTVAHDAQAENEIASRDLARGLRAQQDADFQASLASDRGKERVLIAQKDLQARQQEEEVVRLQKEMAALVIQQQQKAVEQQTIEQRKAASILRIPPEPAVDAPDICDVAFSLPNDHQAKRRRFLNTAPISVLQDFLWSVDLDSQAYHVVRPLPHHLRHTPKPPIM